MWSDVHTFLCWIGWHEWIWKLPDMGTIPVFSSPPNNAKCKHCGVVYKEL